MIFCAIVNLIFFLMRCLQSYPFLYAYFVAQTGLEFMILLPPYPTDVHHYKRQNVYFLLGHFIKFSY